MAVPAKLTEVRHACGPPGSEGRAPVCFWSRRALFERELVTPHWASSRPPPNRARPFLMASLVDGRSVLAGPVIVVAGRSCPLCPAWGQCSDGPERQRRHV